MNDLMIRLFQRVYVEPTTEITNKSQGYVLNAEIAAFGYTLAPELIKVLSSIDEEQYQYHRKMMVIGLKSLTGADVPHKTLFKKFPYETPDELDYMHRRVMQHVQNKFFGGNTNHLMLSCGHVIDPAIFPDVEDHFGACPVCQFQVDELQDDSKPKHDFQSITPLKVLRLADKGFITKSVNQFIARNSSLSSDERTFALDWLDKIDVKIPAEVYRENLPIAYLAAKGDIEKVRHLFKGATDILRIATFLSDAGSDLSLSDNALFRIKGSDAKRLLSLLDGMPNATEDLLRHREKWKKLLHGLHAGSTANRKRYPNAAKATDIVRNNGRGFTTFNAKAEKLTRERTILGENGLASHLSARPGDFIRKLDFMLRHAGNEGQEEVVDYLAKVIDKLSVEVIFAMIKYLPTRAKRGEKRTFFPKGTVTKAKIVEDKREPIHPVGGMFAFLDLQTELIKRFKTLRPMGKVYIDPLLRKQLVPFNRRADSSTAVPVVKGSRYPFGDAPVIRLFTWWKGDIDVDLSAALYNEDFEMVDHISYRHLKSENFMMVHSGDIQNAPKGAAEFVDFSPAHLRSKGIRYVLSHLISYNNNSFNTFPCFAGYMIRDDMKSGRKFEPEAVEQKFDINVPTSQISAHVFDLETNEVIFMDLAGGALMHNNISKSGQTLQEKVEAVLNLHKTKTTLGDVLELHAVARGTIVYDRFEADTVFDLDTVKGLDVMSMEQMGEVGLAE